MSLSLVSHVWSDRAVILQFIYYMECNNICDMLFFYCRLILKVFRGLPISELYINTKVQDTLSSNDCRRQVFPASSISRTDIYLLYFLLLGKYRE